MLHSAPERYALFFRKRVLWILGKHALLHWNTQIAQYYNVSTDYILGLSDNKWTTEQNILVNQFFLKYQDIFEAFEALDDYDKELIRGLIAQMKKIKNERY